MPSRLPDNAALLVVDVQQGFDDEAHWGARSNPSAEANIARLLAAWRASGRPVLHVRHDSRHADSPLRPGQPGNAIKAIVAPRDGEPVYAKDVNSAFIGTTLDADLSARDISTLVVAGLTTPHCVSTTARMASNLGYVTYVVGDATAAFAARWLDGAPRAADEVHRAALSDLHGEFAEVLDTDAVLAAVAPGVPLAAHA